MDDVELSPPLPTMDRAADEMTTLNEMLDYYRAVLARKISGLDAEQLDTALPPSDLTLGGLLFHMALVEDSWFQDKFLGNGEVEPWASADWEADYDWELNNASSFTPEQLMDQYNLSIRRSRDAVLSADSVDQLSAEKHQGGSHWNLRWILVHLIEEYARHCGHADYIRQSIDQVTGD